MKVEDELVLINRSDRRTCENAGRALFNTHHRRYIFSGTSLRLVAKHFIEQTPRNALTGGNGDAGRDADAVVNDSEHVDVVLHACLQARDGAGGRIARNPDL